MKSILSRAIATIIVFIAYVVANILYSPEATLLTAKAAGRQLANDDAGFVSSFHVMRFLSGANGLMTLFFVLIVAAIWWKPIRHWISPLAVLALAVAGSLPRPALAYYDKSDFTEAYTILPNE